MQLLQKRALFVTTTVTLSDRIQISDKSWFRTVEAQSPIDRVSDSPLQIRFFPAMWAIAAVILAFLSVFGFYVHWSAEEVGGLQVGIICSILAVLFGYNVLRLKRDDLVFRDRHTNQVLFTLSRANPSAAEVDTFVARLNELSQRPAPPFGANRQEVIGFYSRVLKQLVEAEVLLPEEFDTIHSRLAPAASVVKLVK